MPNPAYSSNLLRGRRNDGFALVIALSLMAFVLLLLLTISTLVQVDVKSSANSKELTQARQNALLGLQVALGELQRELGPDQRISATASLLDTDPSTEIPDGVGQPQWLGVWNALSWDVTQTPAAPDSIQGKPSQFRRWLVSLNDATTAEAFDTPKGFSATSADALELVSGDSSLDPVYVQKLEIGTTGNAFNGGSYAWWVGDENTKATLAYASDALEDDADLGDLLARTNASSWNSFQVIPDFSDIDSLLINDKGRLSRDGIELMLRKDVASQSPWRQDYFHDYTPIASGLLTDVMSGGFRRDLTSLFEASGALPAAYQDTALYQYGAKWEVLQRHYLRYKDIEFTSGGTPYYDARLSQSDSSDLWETTEERDYVLPIPCRVQYLFSIAVDPWDIYTNEGLTSTADPSAPPVGTPIYYLVMKPVMVLWNSFDVEMRWTMPNKRSIFYLSMGTPPVEISFDGGGSYRALDTMYWDLSQSLFVAEMLPDDDLVLAPGETIVLSLKEKNPQHQRMLIPSGLYNDSSTDFGIYQSAGLNSRNNNMQSGWDEDVVGFHTPLLRNETAADAVDQFIPASESIQLKLRYKANSGSSSDKTVKFAAHINVGSESNPGVAQMGRLATIEFREDVANTSRFLQNEYDLGSLSGSLLPIADSGAENSFLFSVSAEKKVFGELDSGGKLGSFLDPRIPYYYTTDFSSGENALAPVEFQFRDKSSGEPLFQFEPTKSRGYFGSLIEGIYSITANELPVAPMQSLLQLRHAPLGWDYGHAVFRQRAWAGRSQFLSGEVGDEFAAVYNQPLGNAYPHPLMPVDSIVNASRSRTVDHSYYLNSILPDGFIFSGLAPREAGNLYAQAKTQREVFDAWVSGDLELAGGRYRFYNPTDNSVDTIASELFSADGSVTDVCFEKLAAYISVDGLFNVNSTSVNAWVSTLAGLRDVEVPRLSQTLPATVVSEDVTGLPVGRRGILTGGNFSESGDTFEEGVRYWSGFRTLTDAQIRDLAEALVAEIKLRGPFRSLGEFFNREISSRTAFNRYGAVQSAIEASGINDATSALTNQTNRTEFTSADLTDFTFSNNEAFVGGSGEGTNGSITQADVLTPTMPYLSARGDTFIIRSYGDSGSGSILSAKVYCEAIYTRSPGYVDSSTLEPSDIPLPGTLEDRFGRKFMLTSFKWLQPNEI